MTGTIPESRQDRDIWNATRQHRTTDQSGERNIRPLCNNNNKRGKKCEKKFLFHDVQSERAVDHHRHRWLDFDKTSRGQIETQQTKISSWARDLDKIRQTDYLYLTLTGSNSSEESEADSSTTRANSSLVWSRCRRMTPGWLRWQTPAELVRHIKKHRNSNNNNNNAKKILMVHAKL